MVNKLFKAMQGPPTPEGRALVRSMIDTEEIIGPYTLKPGGEEWIPWSAAKRLRDENKVKILRYEQNLVEQMAQGQSVDDVPELPGFFCPECLANGVLKPWGTRHQMQFHRQSHRNLSDGHRCVPHPGAQKRTDPTGIRQREYKRKYMRDYQRKRKGAKDDVVSKKD